MKSFAAATLIATVALIFSLGITTTTAFSLAPSSSRQHSQTCRFAAEGGDEEPEVRKTPIKCPDCDKCDGSGRIMGGIGVIAPWWPIKAYRPCPNYIDGGGFYQRSGQGLDEIAFGRDSKFTPDGK